MLKKDNLLFPNWKVNYSNIICGFTLPEFGNQALTRKSITSNRSTKQNRIYLADKLKISSKDIFSPRLIHSDIVINVDEKKRGMGAHSLNNSIKGDSCITNTKDVLLIVTWADCLPVLLYDPSSKWIAAVHSGWKGTKYNIVRKTINKLEKNDIDVKTLLAAIGPGIRDCCYKVGIEFKDYFKESGLSSFLKEKKNGLYFDLAGSVYKQLLDSGVKSENIDFYGKCNSCSKNPNFFSCRKQGKNFEAQAAFIGLF